MVIVCAAAGACLLLPQASTTMSQAVGMISCVTWVPRGAANPRPSRYQVCTEDVEELKARAELLKLGGLEAVEAAAEEEREESQGAKAGDDDADDADGDELDENGLPKSLKMDEYDDDEEGRDGDEEAPFVHAEEDDVDEEIAGDEEEGDADGEEEGGPEGEEGEMSQEGEMDEDDEDDDEDDDASRDELLSGAHAALGDYDHDEDEDEDDEDDHAIRPTDAVCLVAVTEDEDHSALEVHVYEEQTGNLYVHHDITLPAFPLSLAWMDCPPRLGEGGTQQGRGSFVAVGTFRPGIEIWDLDVLDPLEPSAVLGGEAALAPVKNGKKRKGGKRRSREPTLVPGSHEGPVMSLAWNKHHRQVLASGSADSAVKLWDVTTAQCSATLNHHKDKVVSLQWHPVEGTVLATASFDRGVHVLDARTGTASSAVQLGLKADPECVGWDPHAPYKLLCSTESGGLMAYDVRSPKQALWSLPRAHTKTLSSFSFSQGAPGLLATAGLDKAVRLWDVKGDEPVPLGEKVMSVGKLFSINFYPSSPLLLAAGGDKGIVAIWDLHEVESVARRFGGGSDAAAADETVTQTLEGMTIEEDSERLAASNSGKGSGGVGEEGGVGGGTKKAGKNKGGKSKGKGNK